jgi:di/tricarboxylate transporter
MPYVVSGRFVYSIFGLTRIPPNFKIKIMYNSVIMTTTDWAQFILALVSIGVIVVGAIRWYIKVQVKPIAEAVEDIRKETKTNGGTSMRDEIKQIKIEQENARDKRKATSDKLDHMYDILLDYVSKNSK